MLPKTARRLSTSICRPVLPQEQTSLLRAGTSASCRFCCRSRRGRRPVVPWRRTRALTLRGTTLQPAERRLWAALRVQRAATAVAHAGPIKKCLAVVDQPARRREGLAGWTGVKVARFIERKIIPTEGPVLAFRLVDYRDVRCNLLVVDEPIEVRSRAVGGIGRQALGFEIEALLGALDHRLRRPDLSLADGT